MFPSVFPKFFFVRTSSSVTAAMTSSLSRVAFHSHHRALHFAPWESHEDTVSYEEHSRLAESEDTPYYPIRLVNEKALLTEYQAFAAKESRVTFVGRLGTYRYLDIDVTIREALEAGKRVIG